MKSYLLPLAAAFLTGCGVSSSPNQSPDTDWSEYNGDGAKSHYSPLRQINAQTVQGLKVAWTYKSGGADTANNSSQMQCNPIVIKGVLYGVSADIQAFAVDAATGKQLWKTNVADNGGTSSRGVTYWTDGTTRCIFWGAGQYLYALDAATGRLVEHFGQHGRLNLKTGLERPGADDYVRSNTPNVVFENLIIVGARVSENETALLGDIRAFDARTGRLAWTFHTIPQPGEFGYDTWRPAQPRQRMGGANNWAGMAIDRQRGIVYAPTGSAAFDFYGGGRKGNNLFASSLLALDARTGKRLWHYQLIHHDIWDRDPPATPNLLTITQNGQRIDAVAQVTKQGLVFVFDRVTGKPLFPIEERAFPTLSVAGEAPSPTQPIPVLPAPFTKQTFTEQDINPNAADRPALVAMLRTARTGSPYTPLTAAMTIFFPGTDGGAQWGGAATDPAGTLYIPAKQNPVYSSLVAQQPAAATASASVDGAQLYARNCGGCHGADRQGNHDGSYPSLLGVGARLSTDGIHQVLQKGRGMMPSFSHLPEGERTALVNFLVNNTSATTAATPPLPGRTATSQPERTSSPPAPYQFTGYNRWYDRDGYPVSTPPWGTLTAIDLNTGKQRWQVPLGEYKELTTKGIPLTGTDNYGGPLATAGGLLFIAATRDEHLRAIDQRTGRTVWQAPLPTAGFATPATYAVGGKQYVVIACGGGKLGRKSGDTYVAFALDSQH